MCIVFDSVSIQNGVQCTMYMQSWNGDKIVLLIISRNRLTRCASRSPDTIFKSILKSQLFVRCFLMAILQRKHILNCVIPYYFYFIFFYFSFFILSIDVTAFVLARVNTVIFSND